jgi:hypothetical protein
MSTVKDRVVKCGTHGNAGPAIVCCHIRLETDAVGFNEEPVTPEEPEPMAWCDHCETMRAEIGEWTDQVDKFADMRVVCEICYMRLRANHMRGA